MFIFGRTLVQAKQAKKASIKFSQYLDNHSNMCYNAITPKLVGADDPVRPLVAMTCMTRADRVVGPYTSLGTGGDYS